MKYLKKYTDFFEDGTAAASATTAGMGAVSSAQPGTSPGTTGTTGSGDISFYMLDKKGKKIKKGSPSEVSDMRYLAPTKGITKLKESKLDDDANLVDECLQELYDMGFELNEYKVDMVDDAELLDSSDEEYDIDDDNYGTFKSEEIRISLFKQIEKTWRGNLNLRYNFDKNDVIRKHTSTLRTGGNELEKDESEIVDIAEEASLRIINYLNYTSGTLTIYFQVAGSGQPWNAPRNVNVNIHIVLNRNVYPTNESYTDIEEYVQDIKSMLSNYNIRPIVLNQIIEQYSEVIETYYNEGKYAKIFVDEIIKDLELDSGGFLSTKLGSKSYNQSIKYL